jgi:hypothetical protein
MYNPRLNFSLTDVARPGFRPVDRDVRGVSDRGFITGSSTRALSNVEAQFWHRGSEPELPVILGRLDL